MAYSVTLDQAENLVLVTISTGYGAGDTNIVLSAGHGAELPDPSVGNYNVIWWNSSSYGNPADDPNAELVRVTAKVGDTITVTRAQEGTSATTKNTGAATYKMALVPTAKLISDLQSALEEQWKFIEKLTFTNSSTPQTTSTFPDAASISLYKMVYVAKDTSASLNELRFRVNGISGAGTYSRQYKRSTGQGEDFGDTSTAGLLCTMLSNTSSSGEMILPAQASVGGTITTSHFGMGNTYNMPLFNSVDVSGVGYVQNFTIVPGAAITGTFYFFKMIT